VVGAELAPAMICTVAELITVASDRIGATLTVPAIPVVFVQFGEFVAIYVLGRVTVVTATVAVFMSEASRHSLD